MKAPQKTLALWVILLVVGVLFFQMYETQKNTVVRDFDNAKWVKALQAKQVATVIFNQTSHEIKGEFNEAGQKEFNGKRYQFIGNTDTDGGYKIANENGVTPNYESSDNSFMASLFFNWLPLIFIVLMFMFFMRQIQVGGGKAMAFGKSRARLLTENRNKVTFKDVAGVDEAKEELKEIVAFLKDPKKFTKLGGRIPKGVLLVGPPGTGKTLLARAVAGEANVPFFTISGSDFVEMFVGVGASRVRDLFEQGKKSAPCLIFIDEIDAVGRHRGAGMGGGHDEREQTLNQLLVEMDGFESNDGVILIAATNRPDVLDPALLRPGRFDRRVVVSKPDVKGREQILAVHTRKTPISNAVNLDTIARGTPGFSGADLENLVNEAALYAARENKTRIEMSDFEHAKDKVLMGAERKSMVISEKDRKLTAYHEAGHAIIGRLMPQIDPIHKVTIIPRGMALGVTQTLPEEDQLNLSKTKATNMIAFLFGGRAAEEVVFEDYTTGAANDIERATELARRMVCEWGMSDKLGPLALERREGPVFLGMQNGHHQLYSDNKAQEIDQEVHRLVTTGHQLAKKLLTDNIDILHRMTEILLEYETIDSDEVNMIMKGATLKDVEVHRASKQVTIDAERKQSQQQQQAEEKEKAAASRGGGSRDPVGSSGPVTA